MGQNSITMFTNDSGVAGGPIAYVQDAFPDITDPPNVNTGFSSTISSNPMNNVYGNDDFPRYGAKTLWIKDLVLEPNRGLWINGEPTYRVIFNENFPSAQAYVYGNISLKRNNNQTFVQVRSVGDGFGVGGVFRRCMFLMVGNTAAAAAATGTVLVDGVSNATTVDWSNLATVNPATDPMYAAIAHAGANETYDIHDFRLQANQAGGVFTIAGVVLYSENSTLTIDQFPGITYNNKTRSQSTQNTTLPLPSFGSSLGGRSTIFKNAGGGYSLSALGVTTIQSIATGLSGTTTLNVTVGSGASFSAGNGVISSWGTSMYVGVIQSISTDALTVFPALSFGISNSIYRYFQSGQSQAINASLNIINFSFGSTQMNIQGFTSSSYLDPLQNFAVWGNNYGVTVMDGINTALGFSGPAGFVQCEGYFSAAEIEWFGMSVGVLSGTMVVNGLPVYSHANIGFTGFLKKTVFHTAGPGWNSFAFFPGSSHLNVGISRINLYGRNFDQSASFGLLGAFDTLQAYTSRAVNATCVAPGTYKRTFADQILFRGPWVRGAGTTLPGGVAYYGSTTTCTATFNYWGTNFAVVGGASLGRGASMQISVDAGANQGATAINTIIDGLSQTFHSVSLAVLGGTAVIGAIDFFRQTGEIKSLQTFAQPTLTNPIPVKINRPVNIITLLSGSGTYIPSLGVVSVRVKLMGGGAGGGGVSNASAVAGGGGGGAGGYVEHQYTLPSIAASYAYSIAGTAAGGSTSGGGGTAGNDTTFGALTAPGGGAGGGATTTTAGGVASSGGVPTTGNILNVSGGGGAGGDMGVAAVQSGSAGSGGSSYAGGGGGGQGAGTNSTGNAGLAYGSGGGGGAGSAKAGGVGMSGFIIIEESFA